MSPRSINAERLTSRRGGVSARCPTAISGADPGFDATYHVKLGDLGHTWEVRCTTHAARVRKGVTRRQPT